VDPARSEITRTNLVQIAALYVVDLLCSIQTELNSWAARDISERQGR
jgi:hypothetical protein